MGDATIINENESTCQWSLANIPVEIFLHICSYLDAPFLAHSLSLVCKRFHEILADEAIWKSRIAKRFGSNYPPLPVTDDFDCRIACICIEDQYNHWTRNKYRPILRKDVHYASVDAVHIMQNGERCVTGSRDRSIVIWNLTGILNEGTTELPYLMKTDAHKGWIWCLTSYGDKVFSGSWDNTIKSWDFSSHIEQVSVFECHTAVLALACKGSFMAAGTYTRTVHLFDTREGNKSIGSYVAHRRSVLALSMLGDFIVSASDDQTLSIWDQRAGKILKNLALYDTKAGEKEYPLCVSFDKNLLYVGDTKGMLHLINPNHGLFELVQSYDVGHTNKITCVQHGLGSILTGSIDGTIRISTPTQNPETIFVVEFNGGEVTDFDYRNNILAVGGTDSALELWLPCSV